VAISSIQEYVHGVPITIGSAKRRLGAWRAAVRPTAQHLIDNAYSLLAAGCVDTAAFVHSDFSGFIVTGLGFLFIEWRSRG
jgi:hypothetical protein